MGLPPRVFYTLSDVTARGDCSLADLAGWASAGRFNIVTALPREMHVAPGGERLAFRNGPHLVH
jgi:hypothetical protein